MSNLISRKFLLITLALVLAFVLVILGRVSGDNWMAFAGTLVGLYAGVNMAAKNGEGPTPKDNHVS